MLQLWESNATTSTWKCFGLLLLLKAVKVGVVEAGANLDKLHDRWDVMASNQHHHTERKYSIYRFGPAKKREIVCFVVVYIDEKRA